MYIILAVSFVFFFGGLFKEKNFTIKLFIF
jgi:hypothetical protein